MPRSARSWQIFEVVENSGKNEHLSRCLDSRRLGALFMVFLLFGVVTALTNRLFEGFRACFVPLSAPFWAAWGWEWSILFSAMKSMMTPRIAARTTGRRRRLGWILAPWRILFLCLGAGAHPHEAGGDGFVGADLSVGNLSGGHLGEEADGRFEELMGENDSVTLVQQPWAVVGCTHSHASSDSLVPNLQSPTFAGRCIQTFFHHHLDANQFMQKRGSMRRKACLVCQLRRAFEDASEGYPIQLIPVHEAGGITGDIYMVTTEGSFPGHLFLVDFYVDEVLDARGTVLFREGWDPFTTERLFELLSPANQCASSAICFVELAQERWTWPHPFQAPSGSRLRMVEIPERGDENEQSDCSTWLSTGSSTSFSSLASERSWDAEPGPARLTPGRGGSHPGAWPGSPEASDSEDRHDEQKEGHGDEGIFMQLNMDPSPPTTLPTRSPEVTASLASSGPPPVDRPLHYTNLDDNVCVVRGFLLDYWRGLPWNSAPQHLLVHCMAFCGRSTRAFEVQCPARLFLATHPFRDLRIWCQLQAQPSEVDHFRVFPLAYEIAQNTPSLLMVDNCRGLDVPIAVRYEAPDETFLLTYVATQSLQVHNIIRWVGLHADIHHELEVEWNGLQIDYFRVVTFSPGDLLAIRALPFGIGGGATPTGYSSGSVPGSSQITWSSQERSGEGSLQLQFPQSLEEEDIAFFQYTPPARTRVGRFQAAPWPLDPGPTGAAWIANTQLIGYDAIEEEMGAYVWARGRWPELIIHVVGLNGYFTEPMGNGGISREEIIVAVRRATHALLMPIDPMVFGYVDPQPTPWQTFDYDELHLLAVPRRLEAHEIAVLIAIERLSGGRSYTDFRPSVIHRRQNKWSLLSLVGLGADCQGQLTCTVLLKATLPLGDEWLELHGWQRIDIEIKEDEGTCDEPLIRDRVELPRYHEGDQEQNDVTAFLQWSREEVTTWGTLLEEDCGNVDEDIVSLSQAPLDIPELPEEVAVLADWEVTRVWAAAVDAGFLRLFRAPDVPRTLTVFNLFDHEVSSEPSWVPWQEGLSFSEVIRQVWPELRDGTWDFQAFWPDTALAAQPPGCVVVLGPQEKLLMQSPLHCWYIEIILQLEDHCASYVKAEFTQPELLIKDVLARAPVTAQAHSSEMRIEHNGILLQPYHRIHVQHGDVLTFVVGRSVAQRLVGGRWDPNLDEQIADRLMVAWHMREGEYLCLRPGRRPPRGMGILRGAINFYHDEGWLRRQMKRLWADFQEVPFMLAQLHPSAYSSPLLQRFALLIVVDLGQLGVIMPVIMETSDDDSIPLIGSHVLAFRVRQYISKARLLHIWRIWREAEELHAVELLHNGDRVEHDEEFLVAAGDYFFVRATPRECKRPRLDQQLAFDCREDAHAKTDGSERGVGCLCGISALCSCAIHLSMWTWALVYGIESLCPRPPCYYVARE